MKSVLIGHRGEPDNWPENSLGGFEAVLAAGASYIETDVQLTADAIPVLSHDPGLLRVTGQDIVVPESPYNMIESIPAGYPERFGNKYQSFRIARLEQFVALLKQWPLAKAFIEIKHDSIVTHGQSQVIDTVMETIRPVAARCMLISFDYAALVYTREHYSIPIGWVLPEWSDDNQSLANALHPEYLFCSRKRLPPESETLWQGPWQWAVYTVNDAREASAWLQRGMHLIETDVIRQLMSALEAEHSEGG